MRYDTIGDYMKVKCFDFEHELDLEKAINDFLDNKKIKIEYISYSSSHFECMGEQIYSFSALIFYSNLE